MTTRQLRQQGFTIIEVILVIVGVVALGLGGYWVWKHNDSNTKQNSGTYQNDAEKAEDSPLKTVPAVDNTSDLDEASKTVDDTNPDDDGNNASGLDAELQSLY